MVKINKSVVPPKRLLNEGEHEKQANNALYDGDPDSFQKGKKKFEFKPDIYAHKSVKQQLIKDQFGKCCFCEANFTANGYGDVEHFRPKAGYQQKRSDRVKKPGYYWKAYDWDNLFFFCQICNQKYKKNYFPLKSESQRAVCHHDSIENEVPLLVHPSLDDPEEHIGFREEIPYPRSEKGRKTIEASGIKREQLNEMRRAHLGYVKQNYYFAKIELNRLSRELKEELQLTFNMTIQEIADWINKAKMFISKAARSDRPFANMVRCKFPDLPR